MRAAAICATRTTHTNAYRRARACAPHAGHHGKGPFGDEWGTTLACQVVQERGVVGLVGANSSRYTERVG